MNTIFCFSGTGNSLYVAREIGKRIDADVRPMDLAVTDSGAEVIGFVFPTYFWSLPHRVEQFVSQLEISNPNAYLFAVVTYGGTVFGISGFLDELLREKGRRLHYAANIKCVENYLPNYKVNDKASIHQRVDSLIEAIAADILAREEKKAQAATFLNRRIKKIFPREEGACDRHFSVSPGCTSCGVCERVCPVGNISMAEGRPAFHGQCEHCLACLNMCPAQAIDWKKGTVGKKRYRNPNIALQDWVSFWREGT